MRDRDAVAKVHEKIEVEVLLDERTAEGYLVRTDEDAKQVYVPRRRVRIVSKTPTVVTLSLSERRAIEYNLI